MNTADEVWVDIPGFDGDYKISNTGKVWSKRSSRVLKPMVTGNKRKQYEAVAIGNKNRSRVEKVHRLVLEAFVGPPAVGQIGCHRDDDSRNNNLNNLYWGTYADNAQDRVRLGNHAGQKLLPADVLAIRKRRQSGERGVDLAKEFGITQQMVWNVYSGRTGGHIKE